MQRERERERERERVRERGGRGERKRGCEREGVCVSEQINGREGRGGVGV